MTDVDPEARTGTCTVCGVGVKVRPRTLAGGRVGWSCRRRDLPRQKPEHKARSKRLRRYGLTREEYDALMATHGDGCAICGQLDPDRSLAIDHCHRTQAVRGLLCSSCNLGLGNFRDDPKLLAAAIHYLTRQPQS